LHRLRAIVYMVIILAVSGVASATESPSVKKVHNIRLGAGWYASPSNGVGVGGWEVGAAYHYNLFEYAFLGPAFYYTGMSGQKLLTDMLFYGDTPKDTRLTIQQIRLGLKGSFNPIIKLSRIKYLWPYLGLDLGLAATFISDEGNTITKVSQKSADFYIKPSIGVLLFPRIPFTGYLEFGYNFVPTFAFMDKQFNYYGSPTPIGSGIGVGGFVLEAGLSVMF